ARYLLLSGELIDAAEAAGVGFVTEVVSGDRIWDRAMTMARALAEGGPEALARTKALLHQFSHQALTVEEAAKGTARPRFSEQCQQGLRAFFAKQPAPWIKKS